MCKYSWGRGEKEKLGKSAIC